MPMPKHAGRHTSSFQGLDDNTKSTEESTHACLRRAGLSLEVPMKGGLEHKQLSEAVVPDAVLALHALLSQLLAPA